MSTDSMTPGAGRPLDLLIVEDHPDTIDLLYEILEEYPLNIHSAGTKEEALDRAADVSPSVILLDYILPDSDGLDVLDHLIKSHPQAIVILMSAYGTVQMAVEAIHRGAIDVLDKPFKVQQLELVIQRAIRVATLIAETRAESRELRETFISHDLIGQSPLFLQAMRMASRVALTDATVLITGESGTGKELFARAIHANSPRARKPFFPLNCSAIPDTLLESELFGYRKGAFTGAEEDRPGILDRAEQGTVLLDEIAETSPAFQAKLLRVLQNREFLPLGASRLRHCDVRILVATNKPLREWVRQGRFREDLYFRINGFEIHLVPLRERREDIPLLVDAFAQEIARSQSSSDSQVSSKAHRALRDYDWPGNIRELRNKVEMACILCRRDVLEVADFFPPRKLQDTADPSGRLPFAFPEEGVDLNSLERTLFETALERADFNISRAARLLRVSRHTFRYRCRKHVIPLQRLPGEGQ